MKTSLNASETVNTLRHRQKKILAAIDFSPMSKQVMELASRFAKMHGSELILLHVIESPGGFSDLFRDPHVAEKHKKAVEVALKKMIDESAVDKIKVSMMILEGKVHREMVKAAESILAEMIVMGTSGSETGDHNYMGSNLYSVVKLSNCPVVTINHISKPHDIRKILVPVDPGFGIRELRVLMEMFHETYQAEICLITLVPPGSADKKHVEDYLWKQAEALFSMGIKNVKTLVAESKEVTKGILEIVKAGNFDMIWLETHGRSGISNLLDGSVTDEILFYSPVPVLSLKPVRRENHVEYYHANSVF